MSEPIFSYNKNVLEDASMAADATSESVDVAEAIVFAVHGIWTGDPVGSFIVEAGNDDQNFVTIDISSTGGADNQRLLNVDRAGYRYVRVRYERTSGSGTLNVYVSYKRN